MKFNAIRVILILVLATCMLTGVTWARPPERPERMRIDHVFWDRDSQAFVVSLSAQFGAATAGEKAGFLLHTTLEIKAAGKTYTAYGEDSVVKQSRAVRDSDGFIRLEQLQGVSWDRQGFEDLAEVMVTVELINPADVVITSVGCLFEGVWVGP